MGKSAAGRRGLPRRPVAAGSPGGHEAQRELLRSLRPIDDDPGRARRWTTGRAPRAGPAQARRVHHPPARFQGRRTRLALSRFLLLLGFFAEGVGAGGVDAVAVAVR